ncbi:MAG: glycosyltransferase family 2 protein, partial [Atopobiaceae bacterium]|nr:glycosyltransferase family 2 protein [Atopobiaceae bacterium]
MRISVILPVYNVGPYIGRCIESLQAQTLAELEFIFVDDRSTDGSMEAVEAWAERDGRVRILRNEENLGAGPSRNRGIEAARGDYLSFVDPDDWVSPDFYELLYATAASGGGHDIAKGTRRKVDAEGGEAGPADQELNDRIAGRSPKGQPLYGAFTYEHQSALYRRELFQDGSARYGTSRNAQDTTFLLQVCYQTGDIVLERKAVYYYAQRKGSAVHGADAKRADGEIDALIEKVEFLQRKGVDDSAIRYLLVKARVCLDCFHGSQYRDDAALEDYKHAAARIAEAFAPIPGLFGASGTLPQLKDVPVGSLLTIPGLRAPGEGGVRVSVILPVHDVGDYIGRCVESLRAQLLDGLEFVFVDDRSSDGSMAAVEAWAAEDGRVRILRNAENLGPGPSRNR